MHADNTSISNAPSNLLPDLESAINGKLAHLHEWLKVKKPKPKYCKNRIRRMLNV